MYVISLVFFGFAVRKYKDRYIPAALAMMLWFLLSAVIARPTEATLNYIEVLTAAEKLVFTVMCVLLLWLCVLRKKPLRLDWVPLVGTVLAAVIRIGWSAYSNQALANMGDDAYTVVQQLAQIQEWKNFLLQIVLCAVAVWHIYWMSRPRFIK